MNTKTTKRGTCVKCGKDCALGVRPGLSNYQHPREHRTPEGKRCDGHTHKAKGF